MKIVKEFILREIAGEYVLVPVGTTTQEVNGLITLSDTAQFIWSNLEKVDSLESMVELLIKEYNIDKHNAKQDTIEFIVQLLQMGFIECTNEDKTW